MSTPAITAARLTPSESVLLDIVRVVASIVVAYGHLTSRQFGTGWPPRIDDARMAVSVFFVLSGFVIRYVTVRRPTTGAHYLADRASRIYSVALPALLLTVVLDSISRAHNPAFYAIWNSQPNPPWQQILVNLVFCGNLWTHTVSPLSNSPYWSINVEFGYYLLYGAFFYLAGTRRWLVFAALCLLEGPRVLYLAPLWIAGCVMHDLYQRWNAQKNTLRMLGIASVLCAAVVTALTLLQRSQSAFFQRGPLPKLLAVMNNVGIRPADYIFGIGWTVVFLWLLFLARQFRLQHDGAFARTTRFIAEGTFPIYLIHLPIYICAAACLPYRHSHTLPNVLLFLGTLAVGILAGHPANLFKDWLRNNVFSPATKQHRAPTAQEHTA